MSLKKQLVDLITLRNGRVFTYEELIRYCQMWGAKVSNLERRMRESTDEIEAVRSKKGAIIGYRARQAQGSLF